MFLGLREIRHSIHLLRPLPFFIPNFAKINNEHELFSTEE